MPTSTTQRVSVTLDAPDQVLEGSAVRARVRLDPPDGPVVLGGELVLARTISYRYREEAADGGTHLATARHREVVATAPLPPGDPAGVGRYDAQLIVPVPAPGPPSADAELVSVDWTLRARLALGSGGWAQAVRKVAVLTTAPEFDGLRERAPHTDDRGHTVVELDRLSSRRIAPGQHLTGVVVVAPLHPGPIRAVRVELLLCEHVPGGSHGGPDAVGAKDAATVVAGVELAAPLEVGEDLPMVRLPFSLDVPASLPAPSMATRDFALAWVLRAVVSRPLHRDAYAELTLQGVTAAAG